MNELIYPSIIGYNRIIYCLSNFFQFRKYSTSQIQGALGEDVDEWMIKPQTIL